VDDDAKQVADKFIEVLKKHRVWSREAAAQEVPA
jgi:catalase